MCAREGKQKKIHHQYIKNRKLMGHYRIHFVRHTISKGMIGHNHNYEQNLNVSFSSLTCVLDYEQIEQFERRIKSNI